MKKKKIFLIILVTIMIFNIAIPNVAYAEDGGGIGGILLQPCLNLLASLCDGLVDILQKAITGSDGDTFWVINRTDVNLPLIFGIIAVAVVITISIVAAVVFPPAGAGAVATFVWTTKLMVTTAVGATVAFALVSTLTSAVLPTTFYLPFIEVSPENIIGNKIPLFDINFFDPDDPVEKLVKAEKNLPERIDIPNTDPEDPNIPEYKWLTATAEPVSEMKINGRGYTSLKLTVSDYVGYDIGRIEGIENEIEKCIYEGRKLILGKNDELVVGQNATGIKGLNTSDYQIMAEIDFIKDEDVSTSEISLYRIRFYFYGQLRNGARGENEYKEIKSIAYAMKETISQWYYTLRTIVIIGFMLVLLYIGIRMLITSISSEKAKYKEMLMDWIVSFCLLFFIHYIMIFAIETVELFTSLIRESITDKNGVEFYQICDEKVYNYVEEKLTSINGEPPAEVCMLEDTTWNENGDKVPNKNIVRFPVDNFMNQARLNMQEYRENPKDEEKPIDSTERIGWSIIYIMLTLYTVLFTWIYLKRVVYIAFLILVSPFVILTYAIDRFKDGSAQGFNAWFKEFMFNLSIQPFHLLIYTVFVGIAMELADSSPIYVLVVMGFITHGEKILRKFFGFDKASTAGALSGAVGAGIAITGMQKLFGRKPHHDESAKGSSQSGKENRKPRIKEQDIDYGADLDDDGIGGEDPLVGLPVLGGLGGGNLGSGGPVPTGLPGSNGPRTAVVPSIQAGASPSPTGVRLNSSGAEMNPNGVGLNSGNQAKAAKRKKLKFNPFKASLGSAKRYTYNKAANFSKKVDNMNFARSALGGMAALTTGAAGVMLGAMEGNPQKAAQYAAAAGAVAYKGISSGGKTPSEKKAAREDYLKAGYGSDYKEYQKMQLAKEMKHNLDYRDSLKNMGMKQSEIKDFYENALPEYIEAGIEDFKDMKACEKLQRKGIVQSRAHAIDIAAKAQRIGQDSRSLTLKKMKEHNDTFIAGSVRGKQLLEARGKVEKDRDKKIKNAQQTYSRPEDKDKLAEEIKGINEEYDNNPELKRIENELNQISNRLMNRKNGAIDMFNEFKE